MAKIDEIDYDEIVRKANQLGSTANKMQMSVKDAFQKIQEMSGDWYGSSYDQFVGAVNSSIPALNQIFTDAVSDVPHEVASKAKSYAGTDQNTLTVSFSEQTAIILTDIPKTNKGSKLRFRSDEVKSDQEAIKSKFNSAKESIDECTKISTSLTSAWQSLSGETNIEELKKSFQKLKVLLEQFASILDSAVRTQGNTVEINETAINTVVGATNLAKRTVDDAVDAITHLDDKFKEAASQAALNVTGKN